MNEQEISRQLEQLREALKNAKTKIVEQDELLQQLTGSPHTYAVVIAVNADARKPAPEDFKRGMRVRILKDPWRGSMGVVIGELDSDGDVNVKYDNGGGSDYYRVTDPDDVKLEIVGFFSGTATVAVDGRFLEVLLPKGSRQVSPGDTVTVVTETMQIIDVAAVQFGGDIGYLRRVVDDTFSEVDYQSSVKVVFNGNFSQSLEKGDRVVLDSTGSVITKNLGKDDERFNFTAETNVTWDDIGGLTKAKEQMIEAVELPHKNKEIFEFYGKRPVKGILLYGPAGCGKTLLGKATATSIARMHRGEKESAGFIYVKGPEILDRYVGVAEATIRQIFQGARKHKETYGYPAVVFIDEADAILSKRGSGVSSDIERTIVPMFLTEMGVKYARVLV